MKAILLFLAIEHSYDHLASLPVVEGQQIPYSTSRGYSGTPNAISSGYPTIQTTHAGEITIPKENLGGN